jgi:hypothetical protein
MKEGVGGHDDLRSIYVEIISRGIVNRIDAIIQVRQKDYDGFWRG